MDIDKKREILEEKMKKLKEDMKKLNSKESIKHKRDNDRRKKILGSYYLDLYDSDEKYRKEISDKISKYITRESDKELFDLL